MQILPIEETTFPAEEEFREKYLLKQRPVVIRGLVAQFPAGKLWTPQYIREVCGNVRVDVYDNRNKNSQSAYTRADMSMRFDTFFDEMLSDNPGTLRMFLFNMFKKRPELRNDFPCPPFMKGLMGRMGFMFFGGKDIKVRIHQDMDMANVLLTQFHGRKRVVLVAPEYSRLLYKLPFNTHSLVDLDEPDFENYPGLKHVKLQECVLGPGDSLFMPSGYWHYITYLEGGYAVSYRKLPVNLKWFLRGLLSLAVYLPFDKLMNRVLGPQWLAFKEKLAFERAGRAIEKLGQRDAPLFSHG